MKIKQVFTLMTIVAFGACNPSGSDLLIKVNTKLQNLESITYTSTFKQKDTEMPTANWESVGTMAFDFSANNALGCKIRAVREGEVGFDKIYKDDTLFDIRSESQTLVKFTDSDNNWLYGNLALYSSFYELKELLPVIINDSATDVIRVTDTVLNGMEGYQIQIQTGRPILAGKLVDEQKESRYNLTVRKNDYLPIEWEFVRDNGYSKTTYSNLVTSALPDSLWETGDIEKRYLVLSGEEYRLRARNMLSNQVGKQFPFWKLPSLTGDTLSSGHFRHKLTLYEFFFVGCGGSIQAKPVIDELHGQYQKQGLQILNIEIHNNKKDEVQSFITRYHLNHLTCYQGKELASQLGIYGCPTFVLVNKSGKIVHAAFGNVIVLEDLINDQLNN